MRKVKKLETQGNGDKIKKDGKDYEGHDSIVKDEALRLSQSLDKLLLSYIKKQVI